MNKNEAIKNINTKLKLYRNSQLAPRLMGDTLTAGALTAGCVSVDAPYARVLLLGCGVLIMMSFNYATNFYKDEINTLKNLRSSLKVGINPFENTNVEDFDIELVKKVKEYKKTKGLR